jgi:hypothetical protein
VVERVAGVDDVGRASPVLVREEPRLHDLDVRHSGGVELGPQRAQHHGRHVDRHDPGADASGGEGELPRPGPDVHDDRVGAEAQARQQADLASRPRILLGVVAGDVAGLEVLPPGARHLVEQPLWTTHRPRIARVSG